MSLKRLLLFLLLTLSLLTAHTMTTGDILADGGSAEDCVIPPSGPWPPCATGGDSDESDLPAKSLIMLTNFDNNELHESRQIAAYRNSVYVVRTQDRQQTVWRVTDSMFTQLPIPASQHLRLTQCQERLFVETSDALWLINEQHWPIKLVSQPLRYVIRNQHGCYFKSKGPGDIYRHDLALWRVHSDGVEEVKRWQTSNSDLYSFHSADNGRMVFVQGNANAKANIPSTVYVSDGFSVTSVTRASAAIGGIGRTIFAGNHGYFDAGSWSAYRESGERLFTMPTNGLPTAVIGILDNRLYFTARDEWGNLYIWATDGSETGTVRLRQIEGGSSAGAVLNGRLYFLLSCGDCDATTMHHELWSLGTDGNARRITDVALTDNTPNQANLSVIGDYLYFVADDGIHGRELWRTDGTETERLTDINPNGDSFPADHHTITHDATNIYMIAFDEQKQAQVWQLAVQP